MFSERQLPLTLDDTLELTRLLGRGGMAMVYAANVDLTRFDYAMVVAYGETPLGEGGETRTARRRRRYKAWRERRELEDLVDLCKRFALPIPGDGRAAVKVLLPHLTRGSALTRFRAEWQTLMAIGSPYLVQVYGGGYDAARKAHYFAMELLQDPLTDDELIGLPVADKLAVAAQAAAGLAALHQQGVVHRDVKPDNLIVHTDGRGRRITKVADLGLAKIGFGSDRELTESGALFGTMYYMPPELLEGSKIATPAADVYSLGATLYHLLAGCAPYMGLSELEVMGRLHAGKPPEPLAQVTKGLPKSVTDLVERLMARSVADRPPSMGAVVDELRRCHVGLPDAERAQQHMRLPSRPSSGRHAAVRSFDEETKQAPIEQASTLADLLAITQEDAEIASTVEEKLDAQVSEIVGELTRQATFTMPALKGTTGIHGPPRRWSPWPLVIGGAIAMAALLVIGLIGRCS